MHLSIYIYRLTISAPVSFKGTIIFVWAEIHCLHVNIFRRGRLFVLHICYLLRLWCFISISPLIRVGTTFVSFRLEMFWNVKYRRHRIRLDGAKSTFKMGRTYPGVPCYIETIQMTSCNPPHTPLSFSHSCDKNLLLLSGGKGKTQYFLALGIFQPVSAIWAMKSTTVIHHIVLIAFSENSIFSSSGYFSACFSYLSNEKHNCDSPYCFDCFLWILTCINLASMHSPQYDGEYETQLFRSFLPFRVTGVDLHHDSWNLPLSCGCRQYIQWLLSLL